LQELNKSDATGISYTNLTGILEPFLHSVANCRNKILIQRIVDKIFTPILENNVTREEKESSEEEEEEVDYSKKWVDGGKLSSKT
jgi:hypothetical protein